MKGSSTPVLNRRHSMAGNAQRAEEKARTARRREAKNGLALLRRDHEDIQSEYDGFQTSGGDDRYFLANRILRGLSRHAQLEAEVFYPALRRQAERQGHRKCSALVRDAQKEHRTMAAHMDRLNDVTQDDLFLRQVEDLMVEVRHHVEQEERELFPLAESLLGEPGLMRLWRDLRQRKDELLHQQCVA
jgi:hemerythrin-like domain-containing protein